MGTLPSAAFSLQHHELPPVNLFKAVIPLGKSRLTYKCLMPNVTCKKQTSFLIRKAIKKKNASVTIYMKITEPYFPVVLFIMLYKVVLTFKSVDEILKCDHSNESY